MNRAIIYMAGQCICGHPEWIIMARTVMVSMPMQPSALPFISLSPGTVQLAVILFSVRKRNISAPMSSCAASEWKCEIVPYRACSAIYCLRTGIESM